MTKWLEENRDSLPKGKVLEFGCGGGCFHDWFTSNGMEWECITKDYTGTEFGISSGLIEDITSENEYNIIFSCHSFEHCEQPIRALRKIYKSLIPNGIVIIATPLPVYDQILKGSDDDHIFVLNEWQMEKLLQYTGFKEIKIYKTGDHNRRDSIISVGVKL
ncbi:MAG: methyltransferase domain-containing protein [Nanoarchaeota archaeon]